MKKRKPGHIVTDRYGGRYPNLKTVCRGQCEGMGFVPVRSDDRNEQLRHLWQAAETKKKSKDGWHFVKPELRFQKRVVLRKALRQ